METTRANFLAYLDEWGRRALSHHEFLEIMTTIDMHYEHHIKHPERLKQYLKQPTNTSFDFHNPFDSFDGIGYGYPPSMYMPMMYSNPYHYEPHGWGPGFEGGGIGSGPGPEGYISASAAIAAAAVESATSEASVATSRVTIEADIQDLGSILRILEAHPYDPHTEYNLDLKALHNVRAELQQLDAMVGIRQLKCALVDQLLYFIQGLHINTEHDFKHMVIYGPPGTGKTHIAKLIGSMYAKLGILKRQTFRKVTRTDLVAGYLGQTAIKTAKVVEECLGGCLFIDEVYSLGGGGGDMGDAYIKECVDTLCEALSDHKEDLMVIVAGYETEVKEGFFKMNPGLASRFIWRFTIDEYTPAELRQIFAQKVVDNGWDISSVEAGVLDTWFATKKFAHFGRDMEQLFCYVKIAHGRRIYGKPECARKHLTVADLDRGHEMFLKHDGTPRHIADSCFGLYV